jgi:hypothetical protein
LQLNSTSDRGKLTEHVHEEQLGYVTVPKMNLLLANRSPDHGALLCYDGPLFGGRLAGPDLTNQIAKFHRHFDAGCEEKWLQINRIGTTDPKNQTNALLRRWRSHSRQVNSKDLHGHGDRAMSAGRPHK